jgi:hypothetical protein
MRPTLPISVESTPCSSPIPRPRRCIILLAAFFVVAAPLTLSPLGVDLAYANHRKLYRATCSKLHTSDGTLRISLDHSGGPGCHPPPLLCTALDTLLYRSWRNDVKLVLPVRISMHAKLVRFISRLFLEHSEKFIER